MNKYLIAAVAAVVLVGVGLAGCNKDTTATSPGEQIKQGAQQMGQGFKNAGAKAADYAADAAITTHVKARLAATQGLSSFDIHVETANGVVSLTGTVDMEAQRTLAGKVSAATDGVKGVNNYIKIGEAGGG